jgi:hypothetical protein
MLYQTRTKLANEISEESKPIMSSSRRPPHRREGAKHHRSTNMGIRIDEPVINILTIIIFHG